MTADNLDITAEETISICRAYNVFLQQRKAVGAAPEPLEAYHTPEAAVEPKEVALE